MAFSRINLGPAFQVQSEELFNVGKYRHEHDFCETWRIPNGMEFGACEVKGSRSRQEDAMSVSLEAVKNFGSLPFATQEAILHETFKHLQTDFGQQEHIGSTACCTVSWVDENNILHITTANLGDSSAYVVVVDQDNSLSHFSRLNTLHNPMDANEKERIKVMGGLVYWGRLEGNLAVSRAFGDTKYDRRGISHIPDVTAFTHQLTANQQAFVVVTCDGMDSIKDSIGMLVANYSNCRLSELANLLVRAAYLKNLSDNISTVIYKPCRTPASAIMLDGHGGSAVSVKISNKFYPTLLSMTAYCHDMAWLGAVCERIEAERRKMRHAMQELNQAKEARLSAVRMPIEIYLRKFKSTQDFEVYLEEIGISDDMNQNTIKGFKLTFATNNHEAMITKIVAIADRHNEVVWKTFNSADDGHLKPHRCAFSFYEDDGVGISFHAIMKEVLPVLADGKLIVLEDSHSWNQTNTPTLFAPPLPVRETTETRSGLGLSKEQRK